MIDRLRVVEVPAVHGDDPRVIEKLAPLVLSLVSTQIPAVGIRHRAAPGREVSDTHELHRQIVEGALASLEPKISVNKKFFASPNVFDAAGISGFVSEGPIHIDTFRTHAGLEIAALQLALRLHTACGNNGAQVLCVNSSSGLFAENGDDALFDDTLEAELERTKRGYEFDTRLSLKDKLQRIVQGCYDPNVCEGTVHTFEEQPLSSILFRLYTDIGPNTIHKFISIDPDLPREASFSTTYFLPQSL